MVSVAASLHTICRVHSVLSCSWQFFSLFELGVGMYVEEDNFDSASGFVTSSISLYLPCFVGIQMTVLGRWNFTLCTLWCWCDLAARCI